MEKKLSLAHDIDEILLYSYLSVLLLDTERTPTLPPPPPSVQTGHSSPQIVQTMVHQTAAKKAARARAIKVEHFLIISWTPQSFRQDGKVQKNKPQIPKVSSIEAVFKHLTDLLRIQCAPGVEVDEAQVSGLSFSQGIVFTHPVSGENVVFCPPNQINKF